MFALGEQPQVYIGRERYIASYTFAIGACVTYLVCHPRRLIVGFHSRIE